mmetsp:Transcript_4404/g.15474  ORF Transcript_4404/g.15474 Transcript_4404/m.15474 type:complete len:316 (+) Transcript_4404:937-1884(+)
MQDAPALQRSTGQEGNERSQGVPAVPHPPRQKLEGILRPAAVRRLLRDRSECEAVPLPGAAVPLPERRHHLLHVRGPPQEPRPAPHDRHAHQDRPPHWARRRVLRLVAGPHHRPPQRHLPVRPRQGGHLRPRPAGPGHPQDQADLRARKAGDCGRHVPGEWQHEHGQHQLLLLLRGVCCRAQPGAGEGDAGAARQGAPWQLLEGGDARAARGNVRRIREHGHDEHFEPQARQAPRGQAHLDGACGELRPPRQGGVLPEQDQQVPLQDGHQHRRDPRARCILWPSRLLGRRSRPSMTAAPLLTPPCNGLRRMYCTV